ncbi:hypothetical protein [Methylobacterium nodulans]|uniref:hypothetical protein n=1 Tax=Methylobacterium nodulans TaxID=114616 RepID=UPI0002F90716|nr:hypothetical protein [Methylobacterium nodulans]
MTTIGRTQEEHDRQIAALIAAGEAHETDLFVCVMKFSEDELREDECPRISSSSERRLIPLGALGRA